MENNADQTDVEAFAAPVQAAKFVSRVCVHKLAIRIVLARTVVQTAVGASVACVGAMTTASTINASHPVTRIVAARSVAATVVGVPVEVARMEWRASLALATTTSHSPQ